MNELALFAGGGGGILGGKLLGWRTVCAVEIDPYARGVLLARQRDGMLEPFPIWDDVATFDGRPWRGWVDVVSGGFPCQDISSAGKGAGIRGGRSGLWAEFARIIGEVQPRFVWVENSPTLTSRGLDVVCGDLAALGYDARWGVVSAADAIWTAGCPAIDHERERIWILAFPNTAGERAPAEEQPGRWGGAEPVCSENADAVPGGRDERAGLAEEERRQSANDSQSLSDADGAGCEEQRGAEPARAELEAAECGGWWESEPGLGRVADGVARRVDRLRTIGNGQVPAVVALAWGMLSAVSDQPSAVRTANERENGNGAE